MSFIGNQYVRGWLLVSLETRLLALVAVLSLISLVEFLRVGRQARCWRDYLLLLAFGFIGAAVGVGVDQVTMRIGQEYFLLGKGLPSGPGFQEELIRLGIHAGFVAGAIVAMTLLTIDGRKKGGKPVGRLRLFGFLPGILLLAGAAAVIGGMIAPFCELPWLDSWGSLLKEDRREAFRRVWCIHAGLYGGALLGLVVASLRLHRLRQAASSSTAP